MRNYDIIIVGGGISGAVAAIAASRCKAKTLIIEQYGFLGGMLTAAGVGPMMTFHAGDTQVVRGITDEVIQNLVKKGKSPGHIYDTTTYTYTVTPFDAEAMKGELESMILKSGGEILYHTMLADAKVENGKIKSITVCNKAGLSELSAKVFIDATGDADLSFFSGVEFTKGREGDNANQPMTMNLKVKNVDVEKVKDYIRNNPKDFPSLNGDVSGIDKASRLSVSGFVSLLKEAVDKGIITFNRELLLFFETNNKNEVIINTSRVQGFDSTDPWSLTSAEIEGRKQAREIEEFIKMVPGFENCVPLHTGPSIGVRSSRQIKGLYTLTAQDLLSCKIFEDTIAHGGYPIDIHPPNGEEQTFSEDTHLKWGGMYGIPYRCLINNKVSNLITVGRCISASFEAQGSIRVTPIAGAIGHGGGVAAAYMALNDLGSSKVNVSKVQKTLKEQNAYLSL